MIKRLKSLELERELSKKAQKKRRQVRNKEMKDVKLKLKKLDRTNEALLLQSKANNRHIMIWGSESLQNVATQLLLFWVNDQPQKNAKKSKPKPRFTKLFKNKIPAFVHLAAELGEDAAGFADALDGVIGKRNKSIHFPSWPVLKRKVQQIQGLLEDCSGLEKAYPLEAGIIHNYSIYKRHYDDKLKVPRT